MKTLLLTLVFILTMTFSYGQCSNCVTQYPTGTFSTTSSTLVTVATDISAGEWQVYSVTSGEIYRWTTCGDTDFDTQLTLSSGSCTGPTLVYNDDDCGTQSTIVWTATFTGNVYLLLSEYDCASNSSSMTINWSIVVPPSNNLPCNAIPLTVNMTNCSSYSTYSNEYATDSGEPDPGCASYNGGDVWFSFTVPTSGIYSIDLEEVDLYSCGMAVYSGSCGSLTLVECNDDFQNVGSSDDEYMPYIYNVDGTPGETIWVRIWESNNDVSGDFDICIFGGPTITGDCNKGITICNDLNITLSPSGSGNYQELNDVNESCLDMNEHYSSWFFFSSTVDCEICFTITTSTTTDYDWNIWEGIDCPPTAATIRCSGRNGLATPTTATGLVNTSIDFEDTNDNGGDGFTDCIDAFAGDKFTMLIDNFTGGGNPFVLTWDISVADALDCTPLPVVFLSMDYDCSRKTLTWETASEVNNDYFIIEIGNAFDIDGNLIIDDTYVVIGSGTTNSITNYSYNIDLINKYIVLSQVDYDGTTKNLETKYYSCEDSNELSIRLLPNPADANSIVEIDGEYNNVDIYNMLGEKINAEVKNNQIIGLLKGIYLVRFDNNKPIKLIIQ